MAAPIPRAAPVMIAFFPSRGKPATLVLLDLVMVEDSLCLLYLRCEIHKIWRRDLFVDELWNPLSKTISLMAWSCLNT